MSAGGKCPGARARQSSRFVHRMVTTVTFSYSGVVFMRPRGIPRRCARQVGRATRGGARRRVSPGRTTRAAPARPGGRPWRRPAVAASPAGRAARHHESPSGLRHDATAPGQGVVEFEAAHGGSGPGPRPCQPSADATRQHLHPCLRVVASPVWCAGVERTKSWVENSQLGGFFAGGSKVRRWVRHRGEGGRPSRSPSSSSTFVSNRLSWARSLAVNALVSSRVCRYRPSASRRRISCPCGVRCSAMARRSDEDGSRRTNPRDSRASTTSVTDRGVISSADARW